MEGADATKHREDAVPRQTPVFLEVLSVISSYELTTQINVGSSIFPRDSTSTSHNLGAAGTYSDMPTISYTPISGERYMKALIRPIPPQAVFALIEAGNPADFALTVATRAINGPYNGSSSISRVRQADPKFRTVIEALRRLQSAGAFGASGNSPRRLSSGHATCSTSGRRTTTPCSAWSRRASREGCAE